jgi:uncharacterized repeat protein (TIGR01451 family)
MTRSCPLVLGLAAAVLLLLPAPSRGEAPSAEEIQQLVRQLGDDDYEVRARASERLFDIGMVALPAVHQATAHDDAEIRRRAWRIIADWAAIGSLPALTLQLEPGNPLDSRIQAIDALGRLGPEAKPAMPALTRTLNDKSEFLRRLARDAIARIDPQPAIKVEVSEACCPVTVGDETYYDIQVTNDGTAPATNLRLLARMPRQLAVTQTQAPAHGETKGQRVSFDPITLEPQTSMRYRLHVKAQSAGQARLRIELTMNELPEPVRRDEKTTVQALGDVQAPVPEPPLNRPE